MSSQLYDHVTVEHECRGDWNMSKLDKHLARETAGDNKLRYIERAILRVMPPFLRREVLKLLGDCFNRCCPHGWKESCKQLTLNAIKLLDECPSWISFFLEWHPVLGYDTPDHTPEVVDEAIEAMSSTPDRPLPLHFEEELEFVLSTLTPNTDPTLSPGEYVSNRGGWAVPGSVGPGNSMKVDISGTNYRLSSKNTVGLLMSHDELMDHFYSVKERALIFLKSDEPAKSRSVVSYPLGSYLRSSWLLHRVDLKRSLPDSPLEKGWDWKQEFYQRSSRSWPFHMAIDQASFDRNQPITWILKVMEAIFSKTREWFDPRYHDYFDRVVSLELASFRNMTYFTTSGRVAKGTRYLPSGHRMTSLLGTILNMVEWRLVARELCLSFESVHLGDDACVSFRRRVTLEDIKAGYRNLGLEVNLSKCIAGRNVREFLKEIVTSEGVFSFPARLIRSLIWRSPNSSVADPQAILLSLKELFEMATRRGLMFPKEWATRILINATPRIDRKKWRSWIMLSKARGGLGWGGYHRGFVPTKNFEDASVLRKTLKHVNRSRSHLNELVVYSNLRDILPLPVFSRRRWVLSSSPKKMAPLTGISWNGKAPPDPLPTRADGRNWWINSIRATLGRVKAASPRSLLSKKFLDFLPDPTWNDVTRVLKARRGVVRTVSAFQNNAANFPTLMRRAWNLLVYRRYCGSRILTVEGTGYSAFKKCLRVAPCVPVFL